ncbi:MAG TPA: aminoglycoside phosphotransferase family protein [Thermomicrobiales bacterium]|nr:aminoglycoside phosphotransferase family protein [Thermomicrobiales bacterium]
MIAVPGTFTDWIEQSHGDDGREWLASLPDTFADLCRRWDLAPDGELRHGGKSLVLPVRASAGPAALKVTWMGPTTREEVAALRHWDGRGMVRVLRDDPAVGALLLERLDAEPLLADVPNDEAARIFGHLIRTQSVPAMPGLTRVEAALAELAGNLPGFWEEVDRPYSRDVLDRSLALASELQWSGRPRMVNCDLYDDNVLWSGQHGHWVAIDPWPMAGDPEYGVAQLLWRRVDRMQSVADVDRFLAILCDAGQLDPDLTRACAWIRITDYWLWALGNGLTEDPRRCARLLEWLG